MDSQKNNILPTLLKNRWNSERNASHNDTSDSVAEKRTPTTHDDFNANLTDNSDPRHRDRTTIDKMSTHANLPNGPANDHGLLLVSNGKEGEIYF